MTNMYNGTTTDGAKAISDALELSAYEHKKLERHQKLAQLADEDAVYTISKNVHYVWVDLCFDKAQEWLSIKAQKYDKRKKYPEKDAYDDLVNQLKEIFQVETLEIIRMCYVGFERFNRWIEFTTDSDYVFHMTVPVVKELTTGLLREADYGKMTLGYYASKYSTRICGSSYDATDLKDVMDDILTSEEHKKHLSKVKE